MKEEENLLKLDLKKEQSKQSLNQPEGIQLYIFRALYCIFLCGGLNIFCHILFTILEFMQLMAFPMDKIFSSGWKTYWYGTIGHFFRFFQLVPLWEGNTQFYLITYLITALYMLIILICFIHILFKSTSYSTRPMITNKIIKLLIEFELLLNIPFLRTLFSVFSCQNNSLIVAPDIKCNSGLHVFLIALSIILIILFLILIILFRTTLFEFGANNEHLKALYTSSTEVLLVIVKLILIILYQFVKDDIILSIATFLLSTILLFNFINTQPYSNGFSMKLFFTLYLLFFWSSTLCIIAILLKNSKFEGGILLLLVGYFLIIITISTIEWDYSFDKIFEYANSGNKDGYKTLLEIEFFLKMEETLEDKIRTRPHKVLYSYINHYERNCTDADCPLKKFMNIPLKIENFVKMKVCLLNHAELLYKTALAKFPFNAKLRLSYGLFLYKKLNKKLKGTNEITLLNKYNTNLEDSFLIYKAQRFLQNENDNISNSNSNQNNDKNDIYSITYKPILNNIKSLINKITMNYIDFWTILAISNDNKSENFHKMSRIGSKIKKLNEELLGNIEKLENINIYDQDIFKLYIQYLSEILCDNNQANIYHSKLSDNEQKKHLYNEDNLFELNYKAMSKSEDYRYIILNCSQANFNKICNVSLSICPIFGYSKEEIIGHPFNNFLPELYCVHHKKLLEEKVREFQQKLIIKNVKTRSDSWITDYFIKNKMKYLLPFKVRWTLVSSEDEIIYGIGKMITDNKSLLELEKEIVYILTDKDLIIQSFTSNAPKLLYLHSSAINNNLDIAEYIKEFNYDFISNIENLIDIKESSVASSSIMDNSKKKKRHAKLDLLKKMFLGDSEIKQVIHWKLSDLIEIETNKTNNKKKGVINRRSSFAISNNEQKFQSALIDSIGKNKIKTKGVPVRKISVGYDKDDHIKNYCISNIQDILQNESEKILELKETNISDLNEENFYILNDKKEKIYYRPHHHRFYLSVKEVKLNDTKIGYVFKFEPFIINVEEKNANANNNKNNNNNNNPQAPKFDLSIIAKQVDINDIDKSEISVMSFAANKQSIDQRNSFLFQSNENNPFGLNQENSDAFFMRLNKDKETQFTIDVNTMSYKQLGLFEKYDKSELYELLKLEAVGKISKAAQQAKKDEISEEEEESSSGSDYSSGDESLSEISSGRKNDDLSPRQSTKDIISQDKISQKNSNNLGINTQMSIKTNKNTPVISVTPSSKEPTLNIDQLSAINNVPTNHKHKDNDYYHVDFSNITYYIYNYTSGFVEVIKDQKYKTSQVVKQINSEKEKLSKMNAKYIANPKLAKEKKRNINKKAVNDESNLYSEKTLKIKEIQKALTSKEKQRSIMHLLTASFVILLLVVGTGIMSIMINYHLRDNTFIFYSLIKKSIEFYKNLLIEITLIRELLIINSPYYHNFYDSNQENYFRNYSTKCFEYYLDSSKILSDFTIYTDKLNERQKKLVTDNLIDLYIIDQIESKGINYRPKRYNLLLLSAYHELISALYHISQLSMKEIYTYEDDIYFFIKNGMSNIIINFEKLMETLSDEFYHIVKSGNIIIIICIVVLLVIYLGCFFIFSFFYHKVEERKQSYLSVFYEIGGDFIVQSLAKCEKFSQKLQIQEDNAGGNQADKISLDSSTVDDSDIDNEMQVPSIIKQNRDNKIDISNPEKQTTNNSLIKTKIFGFFIFFILLLCQYSSYIYYYYRLALYKNCIKYEYYVNNYISSFTLPFIGVREFVYDPKKTFYNRPVEEFIEDALKNFYIVLTELSNNQAKYVHYFPQEFSDYLNDLYTNHIHELINDFIREYPENGYNNSSDFFYGTSDYGFFSILTSYIEEIRMLKDITDEYIKKSEAKGYTYNESFYNSPEGQYDEIYQKHRGDADYRELNPANALHTPSFKTILITYRFIIARVMILAYSKLFEIFEGMFSTTTKISLLINIGFIIIVLIGFLFFWLPFVLEENETIFKTKNMLSIIPNELLITLPHINIMLGIDQEND